MSMTENAVKQAFHRLRQRYRQLLREEIAQTVAGTRRRRRRVAAFHFRFADVTLKEFGAYLGEYYPTIEHARSPASASATEYPLADAPRGFCSFCLFRTGTWLGR